ncbi:guanylate kinase [Nakamurella lactea]|uniref:guanylate kinase n=1 Tax=Nakamurella lactea TaxID=459515 RepID=UPI000412856C|nr:guanylate kinase [Nakamurella lactea]
MTAAAGPQQAAHPSPGRLFVLSGPSGVGKSTVLARLRTVLSTLWLSVSVTTRPPRPGDVEGVTYYFVSPERFAELAAGGELLEWAEFAGNLYGTPRRAVLEHIAAGQDVLLEIDVQGARQVRDALAGSAELRPVLIFLAPPSYEELARRLIGRGTESAEIREARLQAARDELAAEPEFDHTVVNHDVEAAVQTLLDLVADQRLR